MLFIADLYHRAMFFLARHILKEHLYIMYLITREKERGVAGERERERDRQTDRQTDRQKQRARTKTACERASTTVSGNKSVCRINIETYEKRH